MVTIPMSGPSQIPYPRYEWHQQLWPMPRFASENVNSIRASLSDGDNNLCLSFHPTPYSISECSSPHSADRSTIYRLAQPESSQQKLPVLNQSSITPFDGVDGCASSKQGECRKCRSATTQSNRPNCSPQQAFVSLKEPRAFASSAQQLWNRSLDSTPRQLNQTPTSPIQCFRHRCNGRSFSSPGNYMRHLREKSGRARSFTCEMCGRNFTRSTAKNKHVRERRCNL